MHAHADFKHGITRTMNGSKKLRYAEKLWNQRLNFQKTKFREKIIKSITYERRYNY